ncbi:MAG: hypothetical protein GF317_02305 [Candidatus Lokiarchaeota archaeon]|nr:hypothetical protein [Candidatus Lokiarchaeota archaeon]MBD3198740.1 hypothetical protein [Candidatus Lokiarchaeota archaeon]
MEAMRKKMLQIGNIIGYVLTVLINSLANIIPLGGRNTGQISESFPNLFVPAGFIFSIWSVIYILLAIFSIYQAKDLFNEEKEDLPFLDQISYFFILSSIANILWILFWHYTVVVVTLMLMLILLISLLMIYNNLEIGISEVSWKEKVFIQLPFSVYLGWITVATIANVTAFLVDLGVSSYGTLAELLTALVIIVAVIITLLILLKRKDIAYSLVIVWALFGIFFKQLPLNIFVSITALVAMIVILVGIAFTAYLIFKER